MKDRRVGNNMRNTKTTKKKGVTKKRSSAQKLNKSTNINAKKRVQSKKRKRKSSLSIKYLKSRVLLSSIIFIGLFMLMALRVTSIKLFKGEEYTKGALGNMIKSESIIIPERGRIVDRNNKVLATSTLTYNVVLSPNDILRTNEAIQSETYTGLEEVLGIKANDIKKIVEDRPTSKNYVLEKKVDAEIVEPLKKLQGVFLEKTYKRQYPSGESAAQVLGFFNKNDEGQYGIEQQYEEYLKGKPGRAFSRVESQKIVTRQIQEAKTGDTITLTLDEVIQQYVTRTMEKYIDQYKPINASAIIMNPSTGEIYSMYSYPSYDPNVYNNLSEQLGSSVWNNLEVEKQSEKLLSAWKNHTMQYMYEPGSTMKPIIMAMALEEGIIKGDETYICHGHRVVQDRTIRCWKTSGHGEQTLEEVLANSCNVGMMDLTADMDNGVFLDYIKRFGFGEATGIDLAGEEVGLLHNSLSAVDKATYSMGQNLTVTPLQLVTAFSAVVNGGYLLEPYIVDSIVDEEGSKVLESKTTFRREVVSTEVSAQVTDYMRRVVDDGTGTAAAIAGYDIGGKTGTGEKWVNINGKLQRPKDEYVVSFIGTAPISNPKVVGLVTFDGLPDKTGASSAAFKEMMQDILPYLDIELKGGGTEAESLVVKVPDVANKTIYDAINSLEQKELEYQLVGIGSKIVNQAPKAGDDWHKGGSVKIYVEPQDMGQIDIVPDLIGKTMEQAKELVGDNYILEGTVTGTIEYQFPLPQTKIEKGNKIIIKKDK